MQERRGSIFENSNLSLEKLVALLHYWAHSLPVKTTSELLNLSTRTVRAWFANLRAICQYWLEHNRRQIGGRNGQRRLIVEIDESLMARRKYSRGRLVKERWILGGYCQETRQGFLTFVPRRDARTLLPIIAENVAHGSRIFSDMWRSYNK